MQCVHGLNKSGKKRMDEQTEALKCWKTLLT